MAESVSRPRWSSNPVARALLALLVLALLSGDALAWPPSLLGALNRDARRLLPKSLAQLMAEREREILDEAARFPPSLGQALADDLNAGRLQAPTVVALDAEGGRAVELLRQQRLTEGLIRLGGFLRVPADLADPVLAVGPAGYPAGVSREYYSFVDANLGKIPVVLEDAAALKLDRAALPAYWQRMLDKSRERAAVIGTELFQRGRLVDYRRVDYRSPVFGVAQLAYSRAVSGIAATWLALWRSARGDLTRQPSPRVVIPREPTSEVRPQTSPVVTASERSAHR
jgi:hypothetical protein